MARDTIQARATRRFKTITITITNCGVTTNLPTILLEFLQQFARKKVFFCHHETGVHLCRTFTFKLGRLRTLGRFFYSACTFVPTRVYVLFAIFKKPYLWSSNTATSASICPTWVHFPNCFLHPFTHWNRNRLHGFSTSLGLQQTVQESFWFRCMVSLSHHDCFSCKFTCWNRNPSCAFDCCCLHRIISLCFDSVLSTSINCCTRSRSKNKLLLRVVAWWWLLRDTFAAEWIDFVCRLRQRFDRSLHSSTNKISRLRMAEPRALSIMSAITSQW